MSQRAASKTKGLIKHHNRTCSNVQRKDKAGERDPSGCSCPWWGKYKDVEISLAKWSGQTIDPRTKGLGRHTLKWLASDDDGSITIERWLNALQKSRTFSDATWNKYREMIGRLFRRAIKWKRVKANPVECVDRKVCTKRETGVRVEDNMEDRLLKACDQLDDVQVRRNRTLLTWEQVDKIRQRVEAGERQKEVAIHFGVSASTVSEIVSGRTWVRNRETYYSVGKEMRRRVIAAFDLGVRLTELLKLTVSMVDFTPLLADVDGTKLVVFKVTLAGRISKGSKTTGKEECVYAGTDRVKTLLVERVAQLEDNPPHRQFLFGREDGSAVKSFDRSWNRLYDLAGLNWGRDKGLTWHTLRHEYISRVCERTKDPFIAQQMARHKAPRPTFTPACRTCWRPQPGSTVNLAPSWKRRPRRQRMPRLQRIAMLRLCRRRKCWYFQLNRAKPADFGTEGSVVRIHSPRPYKNVATRPANAGSFAVQLVPGCPRTRATTSVLRLLLSKRLGTNRAGEFLDCQPAACTCSTASPCATSYCVRPCGTGGGALHRRAARHGNADDVAQPRPALSSRARGSNGTLVRSHGPHAVSRVENGQIASSPFYRASEYPSRSSSQSCERWCGRVVVLQSCTTSLSRRRHRAAYRWPPSVRSRASSFAASWFHSACSRFSAAASSDSRSRRACSSCRWLPSCARAWAFDTNPGYCGPVRGSFPPAGTRSGSLAMAL